MLDCVITSAVIYTLLKDYSLIGEAGFTLHMVVYFRSLLASNTLSLCCFAALEVSAVKM